MKIRKYIKNVKYLIILQLLNYILPLLTLPYLSRVLGPEKFGVVSFFVATITLCSLITEYGLPLSATAEISKNREDSERIALIYSVAITVRLVLSAGLSVVLCICFLSISPFQNEPILFLVGLGVLVGQSFFSSWFFQGFEEFGLITIGSAISRTLYVILIFLFVNVPTDYVRVSAFMSLSALVLGFWSLMIIKMRFGMSYTLPSLKSIIDGFVTGWVLFKSSVSVHLLSQAPIIVSGFLLNAASVGQFAAAIRLTQSLKGLYIPFLQALYPIMAKRSAGTKLDAIRIIKRVGSVLMLFIIASLAVIAFYADLIVALLFGVDYADASTLLLIMLPIVAMGTLQNIFGVQLLLNFGFKNLYSGLNGLAAFLGVGIIFVSSLVLKTGASQLAYAFLILEVTLTVTIIIFSYLRVKRSIG